MIGALNFTGILFLVIQKQNYDPEIMRLSYYLVYYYYRRLFYLNYAAYLHSNFTLTCLLLRDLGALTKFANLSNLASILRNH